MKKKIMIADDDAEMRGEISEILKDEGYEVKTVSNGKAALRLLRKHSYDVLLLDLKMPVMTGFELLQALHTEKIQVKTIVLTGSILGSSLPGETGMTYKEKTRILKLADTVMNKPFDIDKLIEKVKKHTV